MRKITLFFLAALAAAAFAAASPAMAQADQVSVGTGAEYTTGKYGGTESTDTLYIPFIGRYETGRWQLKATVPYIRVSGPANVVGAGADRVALPGAAVRRTESGLGDIVASAFYNVSDERTAAFGLDLGVRVKLGTADEAKGLGTGENDYSLQADFFKRFGELSAFGTLGYRFYGDPPGGDLRDVPYFALGGSYRLSPERSVGLAYDYRPRIISGGSEVSELTAFLSQRLSREWRVQLYGLVGFSDASPDAGVGALVDYRF